VQVEMLMDERKSRTGADRFRDDLKKNPSDVNALRAGRGAGKIGRRRRPRKHQDGLSYAPDDPEMLRDAASSHTRRTVC